MKKICLLVLLISMIFNCNISVSASDTNGEIKVNIPTFDVTVNEVKYDSLYSEYPFLVYNDITYMPMTYDFAAFMGLRITFNMGVNEVYHHGEMIFHVCNENITSAELGQYLMGKPNKSSDIAIIPSYHSYIGNMYDEYDNNSAYPILNYKGITYLPLTWDVMKTQLDWDYSFDNEKGLVIDSSKAVRPTHPNARLFNRMGTESSELVYGNRCYVIYDVDLYMAGSMMWITSDGIKEYNLQDELRGIVNYFNRAYINGSLVKAPVPPELNGNVLTIMCAKKDFGIANVMLSIDLSEGKVI